MLCYLPRAGIFFLNGDGGFENWAYKGSHIKAVGEQDHCLIMKGPPSKNKPKSGKCGIHIYHYQQGTSQNPPPHYAIAAIIKDGGGMIVGFEGDGDLAHSVLVKSQLPLPLVFTAGKDNNVPLGNSKNNEEKRTRMNWGLGGIDEIEAKDYATATTTYTSGKAP
ncbi:hypothetical protein BT96DRAFT_1009519 [Gymnopus androsaceus JB14]|uniref:Uncharacterized protein n=1 Tax=Gymnopus androsaceus JB14 TaxID=1447944 RepID=A0A6A4GCR0_9AGAR|nr:hypothetical protein BT96DRAFT_1009519 [Gymnopus androsaceus JB14]